MKGCVVKYTGASNHCSHGLFSPPPRWGPLKRRGALLPTAPLGPAQTPRGFLPTAPLGPAQAPRGLSNTVGHIQQGGE